MPWPRVSWLPDYAVNRAAIVKIAAEAMESPERLLPPAREIAATTGITLNRVQRLTNHLRAAGVLGLKRVRLPAGAGMPPESRLYVVSVDGQVPFDTSGRYITEKSAERRRTIMAIARMSAARQALFPTAQRITEITGMTTREIYNTISALKRTGDLETKKLKDGPNPARSGRVVVVHVAGGP